MGNSKSKKTKKTKEQPQQIIAPNKRPLIRWTDNGQIPLKNAVGVASNDGNIIKFISCNKSTVITINTYNVKGAKMKTVSKRIKCDEDFDIENCVYCFDDKNNKIYCIHNNTHLYVIDNNMNLKLHHKNRNELLVSGYCKTISLTSIPIEILNICLRFYSNINAEIATKNGNYASITYTNNYNKVIVCGGKLQKNIENKEVIYIPFDKMKKRINGTWWPCIQNFGKYARIIQMHETVYIIGGECDIKYTCRKREYRKNPDSKLIIDPIPCPADSIWRCKLLDIYNGKYEWDAMHLFLPTFLRSFGIINYSNKYLIIFGGTQLKYRRCDDEHEILTDKVYVLNLKDELKYQWWCELNVRLPEKGNYYAICPNKSKVVHLFGYRNAKHYTVKMKDIIAIIDKEEFHQVLPWTENPVAKGIGPMGPIRKLSPSESEYQIKFL